MLLRRRRPIARAAMIGGAGYAAYRAGKHAQANQDSQAEQDAPMDESEEQPPAAPAGQDTAAQRVDALTKLKGLLDAGVLTQEEFDQQKQQLLGGG